jgi:hypothetical protein
MSHEERIQKLETARKMVASLEEQMATGAGVMMVSVDGNMVQYNRDQAIKELEYWRKQVVRYSRSKSRFSSFNLGNSHD